MTPRKPTRILLLSLPLLLMASGCVINFSNPEKTDKQWTLPSSFSDYSAIPGTNRKLQTPSRDNNSKAIAIATYEASKDGTPFNVLFVRAETPSTIKKQFDSEKKDTPSLDIVDIDGEQCAKQLDGTRVICIIRRDKGTISVIANGDASKLQALLKIAREIRTIMPQ